jgi:PIN domain nuclease of toxin-antitoxin system
MRLLLDTHALLWWLMDSPELGLEARAAISDPGGEVLVSVASLWEARIKESLGKLRLPKAFRAAIEDLCLVSTPMSWPGSRGTTGIRSTACSSRRHALPASCS